MPRWLEVIIAFLCIVVLTPVYFVLALIIYLESPGMPLFFQERIGKGGKPFWIWKFRKMGIHESRDGLGVTLENDKRLTRVGRFLEKLKLDELPQFFNVLKGDLSLVGPRPEIARFTNYYPEKWAIVLSVRPGIAGYALMHRTHENYLYPPDCNDPEGFYIERILPKKLDMEMFYIQNRCFLLDIKILLSITLKLCRSIFQIFFYEFFGISQEITVRKSL